MRKDRFVRPFNFGPSGEWAAYAFVRYRDGGILADEALNPEITVRNTAGELELDARVASTTCRRRTSTRGFCSGCRL